MTGRVTAPLTEKWIGRNRCPDARLWALHGREALLARGLPVVRGRCRLTAVGDDAYEGLPVAVGRGRRRKSTGPALRDQREAAPGGLGWAPSRRIQEGRTPPGIGEVVHGLHIPVVAPGTPPQRATGQRFIAIAIVGCDRTGLLCRWWRV